MDSNPLQIVNIDPSLFTVHHDLQNLRASTRQPGVKVSLVGRQTRTAEPSIDEGLLFYPLFYPFSERLLRRPSFRSLALFLKLFEHFWGLCRLCVFVFVQSPAVIHVEWMVIPVMDRFFYCFLQKFYPVVYTVHDLHPFLGHPTSRIQLWGWSWSLKGFDHYFVHTEKTREGLLAKGISADRISLVRTGSLLDRRGKVLRRASGFHILLFGVIREYKGPDLLIEAMAQIPAGLREGWKIQIVGRPDYPIHELEQRAQVLGVPLEIVARYVTDEEMADFAEQSEILVFPYRRIDASGVFASLMSFGKPVIASNIGIFSEVLRSNENGLLVPTEDISALSEALRRLILDPELRKRLGNELSRAENSNVWDEYFHARHVVYRQLANQRK